MDAKRAAALLDENARICRTSGDGMEQELPEQKVEQQKQQQQAPRVHRKDSTVVHEKSLENKRKSSTSSVSSTSNALPLPGLHTLYRRPEFVPRSLKPVIPKGELVLLKPRIVHKPTEATSSLAEQAKSKPPRFVPYEPYPGAVNPIVPNERHKKKVNKNNLDIGVLADQMSLMRTQELDVEKQQATAIKPSSESSTESDEKIRKLTEELQKTKEERDYFHAQVKFQTQVNSELKNLLVASVGEDLQTHVNVLTEDKLQLARALLDTAKNLSTHTEQIEFLAGQCEVWRSKFLASSCIIEELARWKADLTQKNQMLNESTKQLLHATHQIRETQLEMLKNLKFLAKIRYLNLPAIDVISLGAENLNILQQMVLHSGVGMPDTNLHISSGKTSPLCEAEKYAVQALEFTSQPLMATDEALRALFGQAQRPYGVSNLSATNSDADNVPQSNC